ncbi:MAG: lamin tail domain-containing protein [Flavobacteriales bacterium]|nr:lamin tail domain-containing protein [Flavobacteriales bacterium]MDG1779671.1 lamin tail domain-containing protein [Flavobacteriales bacterium]
MRQQILSAFGLILMVLAVSTAQAQIWSESFETDGEGVSYTSSNTFNDGFSDHFARTDGSNIGNVAAPYSGADGGFFWAGEDLDDNGGDLLTSKTLTFTPAIDVTGVAALEVRGLFATGNPGDGWDDSDFVRVEYNLDAAGWVTAMTFTGMAAGSNTGLGFDSDNSGLGDIALTTAFAQFSASIPTGASLEIRIVAQANSASEEFAFDFIGVYDASVAIPGCTDAGACNYNAAATTDDGSCDFTCLGCTDAGACNYDMTATIDDGSCDFTCLGCTDGAACNFDLTATIDDGSCLIIGAPCDDLDPATTEDMVDAMCNCAGMLAPTFDLVINEIHYNPGPFPLFDDLDYEFIEIYNNDIVAVDLEGYTMGGVVFTFPVGASIAPGEYIVVAINAPFYTGNGYQVFEMTSGGLGNGGETVSLFDAAANVVDEVAYDDAAPWAVSPDGQGPTLELNDPSLDNNDGANWHASCGYAGTPGAVNTTIPCVGTPSTIFAVQSNIDVDGNSQSEGTVVELSGIVTAVYAASNLYTVQDGTGAFSGIWAEGAGVAIGDDVTVTGLIIESFDLTLVSGASAVINSSANALPAVEVVSTLDAAQEQWEGVLLEVTGDVSTADLGNGEFGVNDGTGELNVDDLGLLLAPLTVPDTYTLTGPLYYSFGAFKLEPRDAADAQKWGCTDIAFPNYDADAVIDDGSCGNVPGCTDFDADNFDPAATVDDGSCQYLGCTDAGALNFDAMANVDDGSCYFTLPNLVINEIHYNPCADQGVDTDFEFVEIYNADAGVVNLEGLLFSAGFEFAFPMGASMAAGEYIIIAVNAASYTGNGYQVFEMTSGGVNNSGELVQLSDSFANVIDEVTYGTGGAWPSAANGTCPSLELIDPALDNADPANWQASYVPNGTPGAMNSEAPPSTSYTISEIQSDVDVDGDSNKAGELVTTNGIVTAVYTPSNLYTIQDGTGGFSGIWVEGAGVVLGDEVDVTGIVTESFGLTIITSSSAAVLTSGNPLPAAEALPTNDINQEQWEGVLLLVFGQVSNSDLGFGEWVLDDGSGPAYVDDLGIALTPVDLGITYEVTGPNYYSFGNWKLEPRDLNDAKRYGCTDNAFPNYDPLAVVDDGSCANILGCTDPAADNYDPAATQDDGSCVISGCTDVAALNYNALATLDDGSCYFTLPNLVINELHYNPCVVQGDDLDYEYVEIYNAEATIVDLSGFTFNAGFTFTFPDGASMAAGEYIIVATNAATYAGNGYQVFEMEFGNLSNTGATVALEDGFGNVIDTVTYSDSTPWPFEPDGSCTSLELIDPALDNTDPANWQSSFVLFGTPGAMNSQLIAGCTDPTACNYNDLATSDDGSCESTSCQGCTYVSADNYSATATVDDGSCIFTSSCPEDLNGDGLINATDLLQFLGAFGSACE